MEFIIILLFLITYVIVDYRKAKKSNSEEILATILQQVVNQEPTIVEKEVIKETPSEQAKETKQYIQKIVKERDELKDLVKSLHESTTSTINELTILNDSLVGAVRLVELTFDSFASQIHIEGEYVVVEFFISMYDVVDPLRIEELVTNYNLKHKTNITIRLTER